MLSWAERVAQRFGFGFGFEAAEPQATTHASQAAFYFGSGLRPVPLPSCRCRAGAKRCETVQNGALAGKKSPGTVISGKLERLLQARPWELEGALRGVRGGPQARGCAQVWRASKAWRGCRTVGSSWAVLLAPCAIGCLFVCASRALVAPSFRVGAPEGT